MRVLREVDRVLRADGHLIVLSFAPGGLWGFGICCRAAAIRTAEIT